MAKITREEFLSLRSDTITKKNFDRIIDQISTRFTEILKAISVKFSWWDYDNCDPEAEDSNGSFDYTAYNENDTIEFAGDFKMPKPYSEDGIPICWLWTDFEDIAKEAVQNYKNDALKRQIAQLEKDQAIKEKKKELLKSIKSKLNKDELDYLGIK